FSNPNCGPCVLLFQQIGNWQELHRDRITVAIVSSGTVKENFVNVARNGLQHLVLQRQREIAEQYHARVTPTAVVVRTDGTIGSQLAAGADQIRELLSKMIALQPQASDNSGASSLSTLNAGIPDRQSFNG